MLRQGKLGLLIQNDDDTVSPINSLDIKEPQETFGAGTYLRKGNKPSYEEEEKLNPYYIPF